MISKLGVSEFPVPSRSVPRNGNASQGTILKDIVNDLKRLSSIVHHSANEKYTLPVSRNGNSNSVPILRNGNSDSVPVLRNGNLHSVPVLWNGNAYHASIDEKTKL